MSVNSAGTLMHNNTKPSRPGAAGQCRGNTKKSRKEQDGLVRSFCETTVDIRIHYNLVFVLLDQLVHLHEPTGVHSLSMC